jgi:ABC-type transport system involved in cytochrome c biogenesis permease subunit
LYESILFVSLILAGSGFILSKYNKIAPIISYFSAGLLLLLSFYIKGDAGEFALLEAVLNTNFWLSTHVICISIGYGWCLLLAVLSHIDLWSKKKILSISQIRSMVIIALIFTIIGTLLGGLWADQSWGRFWGWDPKENGALLIVLWLVWLVHARLSSHLSHIMYLAGMAFLSVIVAISWFGVNLLSVGLHSYGFIEGISMGLSIFCISEITIISFLVYRKKKML